MNNPEFQISSHSTGLAHTIITYFRHFNGCECIKITHVYASKLKWKAEENLNISRKSHKIVTQISKYHWKGDNKVCELLQEGCCKSAPHRPNAMEFWMKGSFVGLFWIFWSQGHMAIRKAKAVWRPDWVWQYSLSFDKSQYKLWSGVGEGSVVGPLFFVATLCDINVVAVRAMDHLGWDYTSLIAYADDV